MLKPITNWKDMCRALRALRQRPYLCEECNHVWLGPAAESPARCPRRDCRVWGKSPKRDSVGRPPNEEASR